MKRAQPALMAFLLLIGILELSVFLGWLNPALIPAPHMVLQTMFDESQEFLKAFFETTTTVLVGYGLSCVLGLGLAIIFSLSQWMRNAILPFAIFFQTVPIIAIAPLLVIYFGFGSGTVIASTTIVSIFPVLANSLLGLQSVDPGDLELFQLYSASGWQILWKLRLPRAYPSIYAGLQVAAGLSVIGTVAGEFVAGGGLGAMIDAARTQQRIDLVFASLILLSVLGLALVGTLRFGNFMINRVRPYGLHLKN